MQTYFACKTRANIPAARGAADDVPLNSSVHLWCKSVVTWDKMKKEENILQEERNVPLTNVSVCKPLKDPVTSL